MTQDVAHPCLLLPDVSKIRDLHPTHQVVARAAGLENLQAGQRVAELRELHLKRRQARWAGGSWTMHHSTCLQRKHARNPCHSQNLVRCHRRLQTAHVGANTGMSWAGE